MVADIIGEGSNTDTITPGCSASGDQAACKEEGLSYVSMNMSISSTYDQADEFQPLLGQIRKNDEPSTSSGLSYPFPYLHPNYEEDQFDMEANQVPISSSSDSEYDIYDDKKFQEDLRERME